MSFSKCSTCTHEEAPKMKDFASDNLFTWCTNCGNYGIHAAMRRALVQNQISPCMTLTCFDIGCNGNGSDKIGGYNFHGLHGRVIPLACGASMANSKVKVIAFGGDGGTLGEGINHLVHAVRANYNVTFILHNNLNYGLTTGQASATTKKGMKMNSSPDGVTSETLHTLDFIFSLKPTFVARTFSGDVPHMTEVFSEAINHQGFSFVEVFQSCPTYNKETPHEWYLERVYNVNTLPNYDKHDIEMAKEVSKDLENKIAVGVIYKEEQSVPQHLRQPNRMGVTTDVYEETREYSIEDLLVDFK